MLDKQMDQWVTRTGAIAVQVASRDAAAYSKSVSTEEIWTLSYYRASELAGALFLGRLARRTTDPELLVLLTEHFAEEAQHAWLWTDTIRRLGHQPIAIVETYQARYNVEAGIPTSMPEFLALTNVLEQRVYDHFTRHASRLDVHPIIKETLDIC